MDTILVVAQSIYQKIMMEENLLFSIKTMILS